MDSAPVTRNFNAVVEVALNLGFMHPNHRNSTVFLLCDMSILN